MNMIMAQLTEDLMITEETRNHPAYMLEMKNSKSVCKLLINSEKKEEIEISNYFSFFYVSSTELSNKILKIHDTEM